MRSQRFTEVGEKGEQWSVGAEPVVAVPLGEVDVDTGLVGSALPPAIIPEASYFTVKALVPAVLSFTKISTW